MIVPLLPPRAAKSPMLLTTQLPDGIQLMVGAVGRLTSDRPGNGGVRIWSYNSRQAAAAEVQSKPRNALSVLPLTAWPQAIALAQGMEVKHLAYKTGCSGAKVPPDIPCRPAQSCRSATQRSSLSNMAEYYECKCGVVFRIR